jgi:hypothetical protein
MEFTKLVKSSNYGKTFLDKMPKIKTVSSNYKACFRRRISKNLSILVYFGSYGGKNDKMPTIVFAFF